MAEPSQIMVLGVTFLLSAGLTTLALRRRQAPRARLARALRGRFGRRALRRTGSDWEVGDEDHRVRVPIARVLDASDRGDQRIEAEIVHALAETARALGRRPIDAKSADALTDLVPVLLPSHRAEALGARARYTVPLGDGVEVGFAVGEPTAERWLCQSDRGYLDVDDDALLARAVENLRRCSDGVSVLREDHPGREVYVIRHGDGLDGSRLLLQDLWDDIAEVAGDDLVLCAPTRDRVYAAPARQPVSIERMVRHVNEDWVYRPHGVSPRIWVYNGDRLVPWSTHS